MSTLLTLAAAPFPLLWATKLPAVLVLLAVWMAKVVLGTTELPAAHTLVHDRSTIKAHQFLRHISPQSGVSEVLRLRDLVPEGRTPPCGFL